MKNSKLFFKRMLCIVMILSLLVIPGCGKKAAYKEAINALQETTLNEDGSYTVTESLVVAIENAKYTEPKNIIYMIGDGMGFNIVNATQTSYADKLYDGTLAMHHLPIQSQQTTYSSSNVITDSAAGGTALSTGFKTNNGTVAMDHSAKKDYKTVLELAAEKGKSTGIVATKSVTDATPASFTAHVSTRTSQLDIAGMQLEKMIDGSLDLVLGGGYTYFYNSTNDKALSKAKKAGVTYTTDWESVSASSLPLLGVFAPDQINTGDTNMPTVAEMTDLALELLSEDENGFFLMVEGSQIDSEGHANNFSNQMKQTYDFDCAVAVAMKYVAMNPDTVLIITADHETGGLKLPTKLTTDNINKAKYTSDDHTERTVPVFAVGYGTDKLSGINENVDIAIFIASLLGENNFGLQSKHIAIQEETTEVSFDKTNKTYSLALTKEQQSLENVRTLHVTVENTTGNTVPLPKLKVTTDKAKTVEPQASAIGSGESMILSYVLPASCWGEKGLEDISEFVFALNGTQASFNFSSVYVTQREALK